MTDIVQSWPRPTTPRPVVIIGAGDSLRCSLVLNHTHRAGPRHRASTFWQMVALRGSWFTEACYRSSAAGGTPVPDCR